MSESDLPALSGLEQKVMGVVWEQGRVTAEQVREALAAENPMKDSTARTILRRLGDKGFVEHSVEGRTYVYVPRVEQKNVAADAVAGIIDRFCAGSVETLLVGLVDNELLTPKKLKQLADRIHRAESASSSPSRKVKSPRKGGKR